ncbi:chaperonin Cpn60/TCP-1 [Thermobaculum terrenum ATCC BAA-798]|uniref:60 kDa chaperonin n=1 Tax=Thermobaculum terrenum (strain ATCC BAA-798 / CCMEE 7001 / YNP1) TaxID=525904 RepID=D1CHZ2_THET1|nr:TCP-1/cpn60 chaperonin family protein [Thermobaculum terrenum]ACZ43363.1 chaperonin Cpn60/TCP-1 [Thermobaculum terrenum ATCC BAA-798]
MTSGGVLLGEAASAAFIRGVEQMLSLVALTLGPGGGQVLVRSPIDDRGYRVLEDAADVTRAVVALPDPWENMGAMYVRHVAWRVAQAVGDGAATAVVVFGTILLEVHRLVRAGHDPQRLAEAMRSYLPSVCSYLERMARPLDGQRQLVGISETACRDRGLAELVAEALRVLGPRAALEVLSGYGARDKLQLLQGSHWRGSGLLLPRIEAPGGAELAEPAIALTDLEVRDPKDLAPAVVAARQLGAHSLVLLANEVTEEALPWLLAAEQGEGLPTVVARTPGGTSQEQMDALWDLAHLTGGRPLLRVTGATLRGLTATDLGRARRCRVDRDGFGVLGGRGDVRQLCAHVDWLAGRLGSSKEPEDRERYRWRLGRLTGCSGAIMVGGHAGEIDLRKGRARKAIRAAQLALESGVLPGGGVALLRCAHHLWALGDLEGEESRRAICRAMARALRSPCHHIVQSAGLEPGPTLAVMAAESGDIGVDMRVGKSVDMWEASVLDPLPVQRTALQIAVGAAADAVAICALVRPTRPQVSVVP